MRISRIYRMALVIVALLVVATACGDDEPASTTAAPTTAGATTAPEATGVDLASVCPDPIVVQTGWLPGTERAAYYSLIGPGGDLDVEGLKYTGPAAADPNANVEIRMGGPATGFDLTISQLYADRDILIGDADMDEMMSVSETLPSTAVFATLDVHPRILMWDPAVYPDIESVDDIGDTGETVLVASDSVFADAFVGMGSLNAEQIDTSFDHSPVRFVNEGDLFQQGFGNSAPYSYENDIEGWMKPVDYLLIGEFGYPNYAIMAIVRDEVVEEEADCLAELVPLLQQGTVDYMSDPTELNTLISELSIAFQSADPVTPDAAAHAASTMFTEGMMGNGNDDTIGNFDMDRVQEMIDLVVPIFLSQGQDTIATDLVPSDLATNQFIDPDIGS